MKIDVLAFGVHPDDVELSCAGILLAEKKQGKTTGIIDLTQGELGTRGTAETRKQEATDSAKILGVDVRENLSLADGFFSNDEMHQRKVITALRKYTPEIILCNAPEDRHPDHGRSAQLVADAAFLSGLRKIETSGEGMPQAHWRPKYVFHYIQDRFLQPDFVYDISDVFEEKLEAIKAFRTQFNSPGTDEPQTYISTPDFLESVIYRSKMFGKMIGVKYAEGFISKKMIGISSFDAIIKKET
ncbi:bacillithiol biosynthesis deacetylase BshB1 [Ferruginibacter sp. HRS2-29]|uniref:bacillithiol biosynthesis deacetylase BshB1 n=1 Tax=Ferruginibacter sp. HRS2-29 TaxID=2487334 RepID=UPI0020CDF505|nr:bacillithiol biosynthesis deacetylase BshB1 [Ferruginibacter sp. HRS2-29]MCP9753134.1 bacillithiol biosynthesis deacetylase BshB1 [Ferruginibacter sp. HRS2-29]